MEPGDQIYVKEDGFLFSTNDMGKRLSSKYEQKCLR